MGSGSTRHRRVLAALAAVALLAVTGGGCGNVSSAVAFRTGTAAARPAGGRVPVASGDDRVGADAPTPGPAQPVPLAVHVEPAPGTVDVRLDQPIRVEVSGGGLLSLRVTAGGVPVPGLRVGDAFRPDGGLQFGTEYVVTAVVADGRGARHEERSAFATLATGPRTEAWLEPDDGDVVGVGRPIMLSFRHDVPPEQRAAVLARVSVVTRPAMAGAWRWTSDSDVDWRPLQFWPAGTEVTVTADLGGVAIGERWLTESFTQRFTVGDAHRLVVDAATHRMVAFVNGTPVRTMPVSTGSASYPTASGIDLIMSKHRRFEMDSTSVGITGADAYNLVVADAQRLTNSGTFFHAAPWNGLLGEANVSHGCINLSSEDAAWMMDFTLIGDPVEIVNTPVRVAPDNGWGHWNLTAEEWLAG